MTRRMKILSFDGEGRKLERRLGEVDSNERDAGIPFLCVFCRSEILK